MYFLLGNNGCSLDCSVGMNSLDMLISQEYSERLS